MQLTAVVLYLHNNVNLSIFQFLKKIKFENRIGLLLYSLIDPICGLINGPGIITSGSGDAESVSKPFLNGDTWNVTAQKPVESTGFPKKEKTILLKRVNYTLRLIKI